MARPVVALLTDFGTANHYAGTMKGVVLGVCPEVTLVDIAHDVPAHDVLAGARSSWRPAIATFRPGRSFSSSSIRGSDRPAGGWRWKRATIDSWPRTTAS
jgi:hypothetical protein